MAIKTLSKSKISTKNTTLSSEFIIADILLVGSGAGGAAGFGGSGGGGVVYNENFKFSKHERRMVYWRL